MKLKLNSRATLGPRQNVFIELACNQKERKELVFLLDCWIVKEQSLRRWRKWIIIIRLVLLCRWSCECRYWQALSQPVKLNSYSCHAWDNSMRIADREIKKKKLLISTIFFLLTLKTQSKFVDVYIADHLSPIPAINLLPSWHEAEWEENKRFLKVKT